MNITSTSKKTILFTRFYYFVKPVIPRSVQLAMRRRIALWKKAHCKHFWPIDQTAGQAPEGWSGWPEKKKFAFGLMHDVDTQHGRSKCLDLAHLEMELGFRSSFNFVPERYENSNGFLEDLREKGFEIAVHGLKHDGKLFKSKRIFDKRAKKINVYMRQWKSVGFSSPSMHRNLEWVHAINTSYDISTFDTDPFEPYPNGVKTVFPFWVSSKETGSGYVELPYTLPQDHGLYVILEEKSIDIWKQKLDWIAEKGGMVLVNTHPDYMNFTNQAFSREEYPAEFYREFLEYVRNQYKGQYWHTLPRDIARFWREEMVEKDGRLGC
jgi:hypothetical protein